MADSYFAQIFAHPIEDLAKALHSSPYLNYVVLGGLGLLLLGYVLDSYGAQDPREPERLKSSFPLIGHLTGMLSKHSQYFDDLRSKSGKEIATLPVMGGKIYAVWDTALIQSGTRAKTMSFTTVMIHHARGLLGLKNETVDLASNGLMNDLLHTTTPILAGETLKKINVTLLNNTTSMLNDIAPNEVFEIPDLFEWVKATATMAMAEALYGDANPLRKDRGLLDDVWIFESGLRRLTLNVFPSVFARRALAARERLVEALTPLFDEANKVELPLITSSRVEIIRRHGITNSREIARMELAMLHGGTVNTIPAIFWTIAQVFSRPELVAAIRKEVLPHIKFEAGEAQLPIGRLETECPLLLSTYQETLRLCNKAIGTREIIQDTTITDANNRQYLLLAGNTVLMPNSNHISTQLWGPDAKEFKADRFLNWLDKSNKERRAAYLPYGGGKHLCPGRNMAKLEIMGLVVSIALAFEVEDGKREGRPITVPGIIPARIATGVGKPVRGGVAVKMVKRRDWARRLRFVL